ncbi:unnamed protein product [Closterium sp. NIES-65]|nr:unnamed protein product [Closterium sp. NIES-65]
MASRAGGSIGRGAGRAQGSAPGSPPRPMQGRVGDGPGGAGAIFVGGLLTVPAPTSRRSFRYDGPRPPPSGQTQTQPESGSEEEDEEEYGEGEKEEDTEGSGDDSKAAWDPETHGGGEGGDDDDEDHEMDRLESEGREEEVGEGGGRAATEAGSQHVREGGGSVGVKVGGRKAVTIREPRQRKKANKLRERAYPCTFTGEPLGEGVIAPEFLDEDGGSKSSKGTGKGETFPHGGYKGVPDGYVYQWPHAKTWPQLAKGKGMATGGGHVSGGMERWMTTKLTSVQLRQAITKLVVTCDLPFRIVEAEAFHELLILLNRNCAQKNFIPSRWTVSRDTVVYAAAALQSAIVEMLAKEGELGCRVSFTIDMWSAPNNRAWLVVTGHWIDENYQLRTMVFEFREIHGRHTGKQMARVVEETVVQWGLETRCLGFTSDNASSNTAAFRWMSEEGGNPKLCKFCGKKFEGGTNRCAIHLATWKGQEKRAVALCKDAPTAVRDEVRGMYETKAEQQDLKRGAAAAAIHSALDAVSGNPEKKSKITDFFGNEATCAKEDADNALCFLFAALKLPERIADDPVFRYAVQCIARAGPGYVPPKRRYIGGAGLKKTGGYIASLLRPVIDKVGPENVVAVCTDGGSNYASAAKKIASTWPHIEHVPCTTHVLDLMMEDMGKMGWAKGLVEKGGEMITFVRNHHFTRAYMKKVGGKQVLKPAGTRFGTQYIAMARLCEVRSGLAAMVLSDEWKVWAAADKDRKTAAEKFRAAVMDEEWWGVAEFFTSLMAVPFKAMRATDSSAKGMMGKLYNIMLQLTEDINDKLDASSDFLTRTERADITKIVKDRNDVECTRVFKDYIERHYDNKTFKRGKDGAPRRASLVLQEALLTYINMEGSFGKPGAISAREAVKKGEMSMVQWWSWHSTEYPELVALACRVLTQPVLASPCERGWAQWEGVHTARRNRLGSAKCADLVYIAHNWNVVRNWYKKDGGSTVVPGNIPDAPIPPGYNMDEEEDDMLGEEGEDAVLVYEYGEGVVVEKPRKEIGCGEAS